VSRRPILVLAGLLMPVLVACGAGDNTETQHERSVNLPSVHQGDITVAGIRLVPSASAPASGTPGPASGKDQRTLGYLVMSVVNSGDQPDALSNVSLGEGTVKPVGVSVGPSGLQLAPTSSVIYGDPESGGAGPTLAISGLSQPLALGAVMHVTLTFQNAGAIDVDVPVVDATDLGTTSTSAPIATTGTYPSPSTSASVLEP
jgi:hypothetical protein